MIRQLLLPLVLTVSACSGGGPECGNGELDTAEVCDQTELGGLSCTSLGFSGGVLFCRADCGDFDVTACEAPTTCGNGQIDSPEACDGQDLGNQTCESLNAGAGTLSCNANCGTFDLSACGPSADCGNGVIDGSELCDGAELNGATCQSAGFDGGMLGCANNCRGYDTSSCNRACEPQCTGKQCGDDGCGGTCGSCENGASCESGQCSFCPVVDDVCATGTCVIDIAMPTHSVSGSLTLNGGEFPEGVSWRLRFVTPGATPETASESYSIPIQRNGSYSAQMYPGTYDVFFELAIGEFASRELALGSEPVQAGFTVDGPKTLDVALTLHQVSGNLSFDGAPIPENWTYRLFFVPVGQPANTSVGDHRFALLPSSSGNFTGHMFPGTYDVYFAVQSTRGEAPGVVWGREPVAQGLNVSGPTTFDIALQTERVSGTMTLNGAALPENWTYRMSFVPAGEVLNNSRGTHNFGTRPGGSVNFTGQVFAGNYDLYVSLQATTGDKAGLVSGTRLMQSGISVNGETAINVAIETHPISGSIRHNGAPLSTDQRWRLKSVPPGAGPDATIGDHNFGSLDGGPSTYAGNMFPGTYDVYFLENSTSTSPNAIRGYTLIKSNHVVSGPSTLDVAIDTHPVSGSVSFAGATIPSNWDWVLTFVPVGQLPETAEGHHFGNISGGTANYAGSVYPGTYDVFFGVQRITGDTSGVVWGTEPVQRSVVVDGPTQIDVNPTVRPVSGTVRFSGGVVPANWDWRLNFVPVGGSAGTDDHHFGNVAGAAGQFMGQMYPGLYDVTIRIQQLSGSNEGVVWGTRPLKQCVEIR